MHQRHTRGAVWTADPERRGEEIPARSAPDRPRILWARTTWRGSRGRYVAIRLVQAPAPAAKAGHSHRSRAGGDRHQADTAIAWFVEVAIARPGKVEWLPAERCLTEDEARRWARVGF